MKKYLAILLSVLLLMTSAPMVVTAGGEAPALPDGPCFAVSYEEAKEGETVDVTISALNNPGIVSTRVKLYFDTAVLKLTNVLEGEFYGGGYSFGDIDAANGKGSIVINWCYTTKADSTAEWLATLTFEVLAGAYGPSAITIEFSCEDDVYNYDWDTVDFEPYHGQVYVLYPVTGVSLNQTVLDIYNGDSATLTATVLAEGKTDETVAWTTDNPAVATVDENGVVTATGLGTATITVVTAEGGYEASCAVHVTCAHRNVTEVEAAASTCVQHGHKAYTKCEDCSVILSGSDAELPLVDHIHVLSDSVAPSCMVDGSETYTCTVCGDSYTKGIPATGHTAAPIKGTAPTCEADGLTDGEICAICGTVLAAQQTIPALGHDYDSVVTKPDCVNDGYTTYTCSVCGDTYVADRVAAWGHVYANACDAECDYCGDIREITHDYQAEVTPPTCVASGYTVYTCSVCYDTYTGDEVPSLGHTIRVIEGYAPTCTVDGLTDSEVCTVCDAIVIPHQPIFAQGHTPADVQGYAPTCTADGLTDGETCSVCRTVLTAQQPIPATGHSYDAVVTAPTCGAEGYTTHTCAACGDSYVDSAVAATGEHTYDNRDDRTCNGCDHIRNMAGDADGNERVNNRDLGLLQKLLNESDVTIDQEAVDIDGNGKVNNRDLGLLQKLLNQ